jgi:hypothetical protein
MKTVGQSFEADVGDPFSPATPNSPSCPKRGRRSNEPYSSRARLSRQHLRGTQPTIEQLETRCLPTGGLSLHQAYVTQIYQDVLERAPDSGGLSFWSNALDQGVTRSEVAGKLLRSAEALSQSLDALYEAELGRKADEGGRSAFLPLLGQGQELLVQALLFGSAEYMSLHQAGNLSDYLSHLYADTLGRPADLSATTYFSGSQFAGDRICIALAVLHSSEASARLIDGQYQRYLERDPDSSGSQYWIDALANGTSSLTLAQSILGSDEYFNTPHATNDTVMTTAGNSVTVAVAANDQRLFGRAYEVALVKNPTNGSAAVREDGTIIYIPAAGFTGVDVLAYRLQTADGISNLGIVAISVEAA